MKSNIAFLFFFLMFISCIHQPENDLFKTTDGEYASKMGKFVAAYPTKPFHTILRRKIDKNSDLFHEFHVIKSTFGDKKVFSVEYFEMDSIKMENTSKAELFEMIKSDVKSFLANSNFVPEHINETTLQGYEGIFFSFKANTSLRQIMPKAKAEAKVIIRDNTIYYMYYLGNIDRQAQRFLESFRFTK